MPASLMLIQRGEVSTLDELFRQRVNKTPKSTAYLCKNTSDSQWHEISWETLFQKILQVRNALASTGVQAGERILLVVNNSLEWVLMEQAAYEMRVIPVSLSANSAASTIHYIAQDLEAKLVVVESGGLIPTLKNHGYFSSGKTKLLALNNLQHDQQQYNFHLWLSQNLKHPVPEKPQIPPESLATIIYTSGTTGKPKGVMLSHQALLNNAFACIEKIKLNEKDRLFSVTPVSHCLERVAGYYAPIIAGASVSFPNSAGDLKQQIKESKPTILITAPALLDIAYQKTTDNGELSSFNSLLGFYQKNRLKNRIKESYLESLRVIFTGGAKLPEHIVSLSKELKLPIVEGYGLTEAGGIVTTNLPNQNCYGSVGKPMTSAKITIADDGEILIRSNSLMMGYWKNDALTEKALKRHELFTGDIGHFSNKNLYITDRKDQNIHLLTGEKVSPIPIEQRIRQDNLFKYAMLYGENRTKLTVICNLNGHELNKLKQQPFNADTDEDVVSNSSLTKLISVRINTIIKQVPNHKPIEIVIPTLEPWTEQNGLINAKGVINRQNVEEKFRKIIEKTYSLKK